MRKACSKTREKAITKGVVGAHGCAPLREDLLLTILISNWFEAVWKAILANRYSRDLCAFSRRGVVSDPPCMEWTIFSNGLLGNSNAFWLTVTNFCSKIRTISVCFGKCRRSFTIYNLQLKIKANRAAAGKFKTAVAAAEHPAAFESFERQHATDPPDKTVNSAPCSLTTARHFGGNIAEFATNAITTATFTTF